MTSIKLMLPAICGAALLSGCATTIEHPNTFSKVSLKPTTVMPTKAELGSKNSRVVIFAADDSAINLAKSASAGHTLSSELTKHVSVTGAEIVDRNIAKQLQKEISLAELKGNNDYKGPNVADYAISGKVSTASVGKSFSERRTWKDKKGKWHTIPAKCTYRAKVNATMSIYKLPSLQFSKAINVEGSVSASEETRNSNCPYPRSAQESLVRDAASSAVKKARIGFQNYFAPKAYVLERRVKEDKNIFKISKGKAYGFTPDSEISFYQAEIANNPLTGEESIEEAVIAKGTISDRVGEKHAWIVVDDETANLIKLGDYVKVKYEKNWYEIDLSL